MIQISPERLSYAHESYDMYIASSVEIITVVSIAVDIQSCTR